MPTIEELQEQIEKLKSEAAAHRKGKAEERAAREAVEAQLQAIADEKKAAEDKLLKEKGNIDEILARKDKAHQAELEKVRASATEWKGRYEKKAIDEALMLAAGKGNAHDPSEVASLLRGNIGLDDKGDVFIKSGDGIAVDDKGNRVSVDAFVGNWLSTKPHHVKATGGGAGSNGGKETSTGATMRRADFEAKSPLDQRAFVKSGGKLTD